MSVSLANKKKASFKTEKNLLLPYVILTPGPLNFDNNLPDENAKILILYFFFN